MRAVLESHARLLAQYEAVIVEGAGSPAEINLRDRDIANMGFAEAVDCPVILVADIDRGGVFAHIVGTLSCLSESERGAHHRLRHQPLPRRHQAARTGPGLAGSSKPASRCWRCCPICTACSSTPRTRCSRCRRRKGAFRVVVPSLPRMSNHTDFDALRAHPDVDLQLRAPGRSDSRRRPDHPPRQQEHARRPGLAARAGLAGEQIARHLRYGGKVIGICGGFQMLGTAVADPHGVEGAAGDSAALGLLDMTTEMTRDKRLVQVEGVCAFTPAMRRRVSGYEIHMGISQRRRAGAAGLFDRRPPRGRALGG